MKNLYSFAISIDSTGKASLLAASKDADIALKAYSEHEGDKLLFIRPSCDKQSIASATFVVRQESQPDEPTDIDIPEDDDAEIDIEVLKIIASGDKRRADVKEAIAKLEELGIK